MGFADGAAARAGVPTRSDLEPAHEEPQRTGTISRPMYRLIQQSLLTHIRGLLAERYDVTLGHIGTEQPPNVALGELALPVAFELAKRLRKAPRSIAQEIAQAFSETSHAEAAESSQPDAAAAMASVQSMEVAGAGYLNVRFDRAAVVLAMAADRHADVGGPGFRLVEHTSINPNKAAHIGHLRNAILGDTYQRLLRPDGYKSGYEVGVQNYIDNTGVQVADVVVGLVHLQGRTLDDVRALLTQLIETNQRIDYFCWDLYAQVSQWYGADPAEEPARKAVRLATLHALEEGNNDTAEIADMIVTAVLRRHLQTMERLGIEYDFLPRESEILHLHFWEAARQLMVERGVLYLETSGKNAGCWVMRRAPANGEAAEVFAQSDEPDEEAKVIVRSNGTVTYVGKDIAYHLWKFGLLGKDFGYARFHEYPRHTCWISTVDGEQPHPTYGKADAIYNVIDSRQNDPQRNVVQALRGMGFTEAADRYTHLSYEFVALTPRCALDLGFAITEEQRASAYIEVSGRKGFGIKADDLLDRMIAAAQSEVDARHPELALDERTDIARQIGIGAIRYFMLRFARNTVIAFDLRDALSFDGETGPYIQYAATRVANVLRKAATSEQAALDAVNTLPQPVLSSLLTAQGADAIWETWLMASKLTLVLDQAITAAEPAHLARYAFQLAQQSNNFYHSHHILNEEDADRKTLLLATAAMAHRQMVRTLAVLGIEAPPVM
jgi:arginyl-tRNA synthetase